MSDLKTNNASVASEADVPGDGSGMLTLLKALRDRGVSRAVAMVRHGAREFVAGRHDLENPLTDIGRAQSRRFGAQLLPGMRVRGYASPAHRCIETAQLALQGYADVGGQVTRTRPMEGLGVFYVLDQMRMFRSMSGAMNSAATGAGMNSFLDRWFTGEIGHDVMLPSRVAAASLLGMMRARLRDLAAEPSLDLLVSHDLTLYLLRHELLGQTRESVGPVSFLDGLVLYEADGQSFLQTPHGAAKAI